MPRCRDNRRARLRRRKREQKRLNTGTIFHFPDGTKIWFKPGELYISKFEPCDMVDEETGLVGPGLEVTLTRRTKP